MMKKKYNRFTLRNNNEFSLLVMLVLIMLAFGFFSKGFFTTNNLMQVTIQMVELSLITIGMSICIISGGFDLSIGAIMGFGSVLVATLLSQGYGIVMTLLLVMIICMLFGIINGLIIGYFKVNPMLTTLGTSSFIMGISLVISKGRAISGLPEKFFVLGQTSFGFVPKQTVLLIIVLVFSIVLLDSTRWGRSVYLIGDNEKTAFFSGINVSFNTLLVYVYSAFMAFLAALVITSRLGTGRADLGETYVLQSVAAAILGGVGIAGGTGSLLGSIFGVAIFAVISNGFNLLNMSQYMNMIVTGSMLILVLAFRMKDGSFNLIKNKLFRRITNK